MSTRTRLILLAVVSLLSALALVTPRILGFHTVPLPRGPAVDYALEDWAAALKSAVTPAGVDYDTLRSARDPLLRFAKAMSTHGPETAPEAFATAPERLAYYINAYNALVLYAVIVHQPKNGVGDVRGLVEPVERFGFFYAQGFELDGERVNLYNLENDVIRKLGDARIHAAINCASISCPPLRPEPFHAARLNAELDAVTRAWVASDAHVRVDADAVYLSAIFDWFPEDFEAHAAKLGGENSLDWIEHYLEGPKRDAFRAARAEGRPVRFMTYDWGLNRAPPGSATSTSTSADT